MHNVKLSIKKEMWSKQNTLCHVLFGMDLDELLIEFFGEGTFLGRKWCLLAKFLELKRDFFKAPQSEASPKNLNLDFNLKIRWIRKKSAILRNPT